MIDTFDTNRKLMNACANFLSGTLSESAASDPAIVNERLSLALTTSRQIAFDWRIGSDTICFCGELLGHFNALPVDAGGCCASVDLFAIVHHEDREALHRHIVRALKGEERHDGVHRVEIRLRDKMQEWRWVDIGGRVVERDENRRALRLVGSISDIDERKQAEMKLFRLRDLYMALSQTNQAIVRIRERGALFAEICRIAVEHGHFGMAWIGLFDHDGNAMIPAAAYGASLDAVSNRLVEFDFQSCASFPFFRHGKLFGALNLYASEKNLFDDSLIELLEEMTRDISFAIDNYECESEREEIRNALIDSEQFKSAILTAALDSIISIDDKGDIIGFNHAAKRMFGLREENALGRNLVDVLVPEPWREKMRAGMASLLSNTESWLLNQRIELTAMRVDGLPLPVELAIVPVKVRQRQIFTAFIRDISELKQSQALLNESAMRYRQLVELSPEAIFVYRDNRFVLVNQAAAKMLGVRDAHELIGRSVLDFIHPHHRADYRDKIQLMQADRTEQFVEQRWLRNDGAEFHAEVAASLLVYDGASATQAVVRDITVRKRAEELQLGQNRILNMVATGVELHDILKEIALFIEAQSDRGLCSILLLDSDGKMLSNGASPSLPASYHEEIDGLPVAAFSGSCGTAIFREEPVVVTDIACDPLWATSRDLALRHGLRACSSWPIFGKHRKMLGTVALYFRDPIAPTEQELQLFNICTNLAGIAIESRASDERIRYLAHYDGLTSLPNRFLFKEFLELALRNAQRHGTKFAVFFIDLDRFKDINDTLGHEAGDQVLREIALRLRACLRQTDKIARMGGDEFYILIEELDDGRYAAEVAQKLLEEASRPVVIDGHECRLSASIGIGIYPDDGYNGQSLLKNADQAMYRAKSAGKNGYRFFSSKDPMELIRLKQVGEEHILHGDARNFSEHREQPPML